MTQIGWYKIAAGHNNANGYVSLPWTVRTQKIDWGRRQVAGDGLTKFDGFGSTQLIIDAIKRSELSALLTTTIGFTAAAKSKLVTVRLRRNFDRAFADFNATIDYPEMDGEGLGGWRNVVFALHHISALTATDEY